MCRRRVGLDFAQWWVGVSFFPASSLHWGGFSLHRSLVLDHFAHATWKCDYTCGFFFFSPLLFTGRSPWFFFSLSLFGLPWADVFFFHFFGTAIHFPSHLAHSQPHKFRSRSFHIVLLFFFLCIFGFFFFESFKNFILMAFIHGSKSVPSFPSFPMAPPHRIDPATLAKIVLYSTLTLMYQITPFPIYHFVFSLSTLPPFRHFQ